MSRSKGGRVPFTERNPVTIAVVGLVVTALLLGSARWNQLPLVDHSVDYRAVFSDASGLVAGEEVRVAGVKVGTVRDVRLDRDRVLVDFDVSGVRLGERTGASIEVKTLLGQHYLSVIPAGAGALEPGAEIPVERTSTPLNIVPAFNQLARQTARIDTDQVAAAFDALAKTLERTAPEMQGTLSGLSALSRSVTKRDEQIRDLFARADQVSGVVAARDRELGELLTASTQVLTVLDQRRRTIQRLIAGTTALAEQLTRLVDDDARQLRPALRELSSVLAILRRNARQIEQTLTYAAPYAREFTNVGGTGQWFDASLKFPRGFAVCSTNDSTDPSHGVLDPVLSQVNEAVNGSTTPCLPLGPAVSSRLSLGLPAPNRGGDR